MKKIFQHLFKKKHPHVGQVTVQDSNVYSDTTKTGHDLKMNEKEFDVNIEEQGPKTKIRIAGSPNSIEVINGYIYINGNPANGYKGDLMPTKEVSIYVSGTIRNVSGNIKLVMADEITGRVETTGDVDCQGSIEGDIDTTGSITCRGDINGNVSSDGSVTCAGNISGSIQTSGSLNFRR